MSPEFPSLHSPPTPGDSPPIESDMDFIVRASNAPHRPIPEGQTFPDRGTSDLSMLDMSRGDVARANELLRKALAIVRRG